MARIKLRLGDNEIEVDSRDFYIDNDTVGTVIDNLTSHLPDNKASLVHISDPKAYLPNRSALASLDDAEAFEPEFSEPKSISTDEIRSKLQILESSRFFDTPRTVGEIAQQLREYGWSANLLDISIVLARMAMYKELARHTSDDKVQYMIYPLVV